jgi:hypothetical protein
MRTFVVFAFLGAIVLAYMFGTGQLRIEDGLLLYEAPPSHEDEYGHSGHEHDASYCMTAKLCATEIAQHDQDRVGSVENGVELRSVKAEGAQVIYEYRMSLSKDEFESAVPPPDEWLKGNKDSFCADELNWPMTDRGVVTVMRFYGSDETLLGEVRIDKCPR